MLAKVMVARGPAGCLAAIGGRLGDSRISIDLAYRRSAIRLS